jgi:hypothetical protein
MHLAAVERLGAGLLVAAVAALLIGCGPSPAQQVVRYGGHALRALDAEAAPRYTAAHQTALREEQTLEAYSARMEPWQTLQQSMQTAYDAFVAADQAIEGLGEEVGLRMAACLLSSLGVVAESLRALDLPVPPALTQALQAGESFAGSCREAAP